MCAADELHGVVEEEAQQHWTVWAREPGGRVWWVPGGEQASLDETLPWSVMMRQKGKGKERGERASGARTEKSEMCCDRVRQMALTRHKATRQKHGWEREEGRRKGKIIGKKKPGACLYPGSTNALH